MRNGFFIIIIFVIIFVIVKKKDHDKSVNLTTYNTIDTLKIEESPWKVLSCIKSNDSVYVYKVTWDQKYGVTKTAYCMAIFKNESTNEYKLIAPWLNTVLIEKQNINDIDIAKVEKKSMPDYNKK